MFDPVMNMGGSVPGYTGMFGDIGWLKSIIFIGFHRGVDIGFCE